MENKKRIIDQRNKEKFQVDDAYLNGMAKKCGWQATLVYICLCRHANKEQECFPSIKLMSEKLGVGRNTTIKGIKNLEKYNIIKVERERLKNGTWLNNVYILIDKSEWKEYQVANSNKGVVANKDLDSVPQGLGVVSIRDTKDTHNINETHNKDITANAVGNEINFLIDLFKSVNPAYQQLFKRKPQREAISRLAKSMGREKLEQAIKILPEIRTNKYAPVITTPTQLEEKMGSLISFLQRNSQSNIIKL